MGLLQSCAKQLTWFYSVSTVQRFAFYLFCEPFNGHIVHSLAFFLPGSVQGIQNEFLMGLGVWKQGKICTKLNLSVANIDCSPWLVDVARYIGCGKGINAPITSFYFTACSIYYNSHNLSTHVNSCKEHRANKTYIATRLSKKWVHFSLYIASLMQHFISLTHILLVKRL